MKQTLVFVLVLLCVGCKKDEPIQPHVATVELKVAGIECTDALLKVSLTDPGPPRTVALKRDGQTVLMVQLLSSDSVLIDEGLLPRHTYSYAAVRVQDTTEVDVSAPVQLTTLDTTSDDFTWTTDTLGEGFSNVLNDVAIINDTLAYAVGEIYLNDSTGQLDPIRYNAAVWNGTTWGIQRIPYHYQGQPYFNPIQGTIAVPPRDIWFVGNGVMYWNGATYVPIDVSSVWGQEQINKIWGSSSSDLYIVGERGSIAHYGSGSWQRVQSGTQETINDIWGGSNPLLGDNVAVAAVGFLTVPGESKLLIVRGSSSRADTLLWPYPLSPRRSVWFDQNSRIYTCGVGLAVSSNTGWQFIPGLPAVYTRAVRGNGPNDIVVAGDQGLLVHYNGASWHVYPSSGADTHEAVAIKGNLIIAVGRMGTRAFTLVGHR